MKSFQPETDKTAIPQIVMEGCSGFGIAAMRRNDGVLVCYTSRDVVIGKEFPEEITVFGRTYTLEDQGKGDEGFEWAEYC